MLTCPKVALSIDERDALLSDSLLFCETANVPHSTRPALIRRDPVDIPSVTFAISTADLSVTAAHDLQRFLADLSGLVLKATTSWRNLDLLNRPLR